MAENTSATGGYLRQVLGSGYGQDLDRFFHALLVGLTGFAGTLVRPMWQHNPPALPAPATDWLGFAVKTIPAKGGAYVEPCTFTEPVDPPAEGDPVPPPVISEGATISRDETLELALQVYGENCVLNACCIRDYLELGQNREVLFLAGVGYVSASDVLYMPELVNGIFYKRADLTLTFKRRTQRTMRVLSFVQAVGDVNEQAFETTVPTP